jgi:hypothetical protein
MFQLIKIFGVLSAFFFSYLYFYQSFWSEEVWKKTLGVAKLFGVHVKENDLN